MLLSNCYFGIILGVVAAHPISTISKEKDFFSVKSVFVIQKEAKLSILDDKQRPF